MYSRCLLLSLPAAPLTFSPHNKRAPLNALYGVKVGVLESCHLIGSEDFAIPQSLNILMCLWKCSQNIFTLDVSTIIKKFPPNVDLQIIERYLNSQHKCSRISFDISEADPGHHRERQPQMWGCQPIILSFSRKLHENE